MDYKNSCIYLILVINGQNNIQFLLLLPETNKRRSNVPYLSQLAVEAACISVRDNVCNILSCRNTAPS